MDYKKIGFKCGLEIHQQLDGKKLFCDCAALNTPDDPEQEAKRKLRAVVGETGQIDAAAAHETKKEKTFHYVSNKQDTCLVEYDEQPPNPINHDLVEVAMQVAMLMHMKIVDEVQVMRKTVVDGSNVSGFQRTALVARNGYIETSKGKVVIDSLCLEEEAAQKLDTSETGAKYKLDRLGIALLEIATAPDIVDAEHAKEAAGIMGMMLRSTERMKRGLGTIRQDVNISIKGAARTEIKGFQDLRSIPKVIDHEIKRQQELIAKEKKIEKQVRKAEPDFSTSFLRPMPGAARLYPETDVLPLRITDAMIKEVKVPELITEKALRVEKDFKLNEELAKEIIKQGINFEQWATAYQNVDNKFIAQVLIETPKELKSRLKLNADKLKKTDYQEVLNLLNEGKVAKEAIIEILEAKIKGKQIDLAQYKPADTSKIDKEVQEMMKKSPNLNPGAYMGMLMQKYRGKVDGKVLMDLIKKHLK